MERARIEAQVRAQGEKDQAHRQALEALTNAYPHSQSEFAQNYSQAFGRLQSSIQEEIASLNFDHSNEQQMRDLILQEKANINYLIESKQSLMEDRALRL
ncbi:hypothetical protein AO287_06315 [Pseudomonas savastanoi]|uniref:Uncharacterized protein n=1 Tax=Pseudomonas savastanoi TaxID=29438 RepID=A0AAW3LTP6_PSESS|nr:hypothetical protein AO287_06315 [Pseudomonas savastanoi]